MDLFLVGTGTVGGSLLEILSEREGDEATHSTEIRLAGASNSRKMLLDEDGISPRACVAQLASSSTSTDLEALVQRALARKGARTIAVDCTAGDDFPALYPRLLRGGVTVVTANKRPFSGPYDDYRKLHAAAREGGSALAYETTVGAALPVVRSVRELARAGDRVRRIEGLLSGTLGYLCDRLHEGAPFSESLREAHDRGFTEPDPRDDLRGSDVMRKLLILCREAGWELEPRAIDVEAMLPGDDWQTIPLDRFWEELPALDAHFASIVRDAAERQQRLCYLADSGPDGGRPRVRLQAIDAEHPCATVRGSENLVALTTDVYADMPLVVSGPGAGPRVTAAGVLADVVSAAQG